MISLLWESYKTYNHTAQYNPDDLNTEAGGIHSNQHGLNVPYQYTIL